MNIALIGYGRMGHEIESIAVQRGHNVKLIVDVYNIGDLNDNNLKDINAAIEFSSPGSAFENVAACLSRKVPVVSGTTGWLEKFEKAADICLKNKTAFIHSSNFSIGVNLLFRLNRELALQMGRFNSYNVSIEEIHHTKKLDAPSGTAISLADGIASGHKGYTGYNVIASEGKSKVPIHSVREGSVPGTHIVTWDSEIDAISLKHEAKNRRGFALGAVVAAEYISTRQGIFSMNEVLGF
jgi:4-hydroxy-tetrahydrodipicolinate reductase